MNPLLMTALSGGVGWTQRLPGPTIESPVEGSPGFDGFLATFFLAVAVIVLAVSFTRRMRRADHRDRVRDRTDVPEGATEPSGTTTDAAAPGGLEQAAATEGPDAPDTAADAPPAAGSR